jgi:hypothetical protein
VCTVSLPFATGGLTRAAVGLLQPNCSSDTLNVTLSKTDLAQESGHESCRCPDAPNKTNSVQDGVGRLWGYDAEQQRPCAYKSADGTSVFYAGYKLVRSLAGLVQGHSRRFCLKGYLRGAWLNSIVPPLQHTSCQGPWPLDLQMFTCLTLRHVYHCAGGVGDGSSLYRPPNLLQLHAGH